MFFVYIYYTSSAKIEKKDRPREKTNLDYLIAVINSTMSLCGNSSNEENTPLTPNLLKVITNLLFTFRNYEQLH